MSRPTISEELFERYCSDVGVQYEPIQTEEGVRTPDYRLTMSRHTVIAEVKQVDPNDEELRLMKQLEEHGHTEAFGGVPGHRAHRKIKKTAPQLRRLAKGRYPAMVVLYNNVPLTTHHTEAYAIKTAMHGLEAVHFAVPEDPSSLSYVVDQRFGGRRSVTPSDNTTISAVAVLARRPDGVLFLCVYHNSDSALPIEPSWLRNSQTLHANLEEKVDGQFQDWCKV